MWGIAAVAANPRGAAQNGSPHLRQLSVASDGRARQHAFDNRESGGSVVAAQHGIVLVPGIPVRARKSTARMLEIARQLA